MPVPSLDDINARMEGLDIDASIRKDVRVLVAKMREDERALIFMAPNDDELKGALLDLLEGQRKELPSRGGDPLDGVRRFETWLYGSPADDVINGVSSPAKQGKGTKKQ